MRHQYQLQANQDIVPFRVNEPKMIGPFSINEIRPVMVLGLVGTAIGLTNYGLALGVIITLIQIKLGKNFPPGFLYHYLWYQGLMFGVKINGYLPDPIKRRFTQ